MKTPLRFFVLVGCVISGEGEEDGANLELPLELDLLKSYETITAGPQATLLSPPMTRPSHADVMALFVFPPT